jgi:hypothetical protein
VLRLIAEGATNEQIAQQLHLRTGTVRNHNRRAYRKLGVTDRTQAAIRAIELGIVPRSAREDVPALAAKPAPLELLIPKAETDPERKPTEASRERDMG